MAIYPLFLGVEGYLAIAFPKTLFFWVAAGATVVALTFMFICIKERFEMADYYIENEPHRRITIAEFAILIFIGLTLISAAVSLLRNPVWQNLRLDNPVVWFGASHRYEGFISLLGYALIFVIIARFYKPKEVHLLLIAVSAGIISIIGVLQFLGLDMLRLFPFEHQSLTDAAGNPLYGPLSAHFRTTLGNVNFVSSYCSFTILLFAALFTVSKSKFKYLYLGAGSCSFALSLTTGFSGDAHIVAILGSMILLIPYWVSDRERLGRILIVLSSWCMIYAAHSAYMSEMKRQLEAGKFFPPLDQQLLNEYAHKNIILFLILAVVLLAAGLALTLILKKWAEKPLKIVGVVLLPVLVIGGVAGLEIVGSRLSEHPNSTIWQAREMMHGRLSDDFGSNRGWIWRNAIEVIPDNPIFGTGPDTFYHALGAERQAEAFELHGFTHDRAHNMFLQIAVCMGIPALIAYLIFLGSVFIPAIKRAFNRPILFAFGAAALSYVIQSFFAVGTAITTPLLWIALGVMAGEVWMSKIEYKSTEV
jgi:O-antigen ligase